MFVVGLLGLMGLMGNMLHAQTDWKKVERLLNEGSYKSAYTEAESVYKKTRNSNELLTAAWYMSRAAAEYQEDYYDSAVAHYRAILPRLDAVDRAVCYAFLGDKDSALMDEGTLKQTDSERLKRFCYEERYGDDLKGVNLTPTAYDVVMNALLERDRKNVALMQKLIDFHQGDDDFIRITLDLKLLDLQGYNPRSVRYQERVQGYINKYRGSSCPLLAQLYHRMAEHLSNNGRKVEALSYCDTAIALFPKSFGGGNCANLRSTICREYIGFNYSSEGTAYPDRPSLHSLSCNNLSRIHFAVYPFKGKDVDKFIKRLPKAVHRWSLEVNDDGSHNAHDLIFSVPALPMGRYVLMASADEKFNDGDAYMTLECCDFAICNVGNGEFMMLDVVSGAPIKGQKVVLLYYYEKKTFDTVSTQADGRFSIPANKYVESLCIERGGVTFERNVWTYGRETLEERKQNVDAHVVFDRPIYRPGDTVHYAAVLYKTDRVDGRVASNRGVTLKIYDPFRNDVERLSLFADDHGVVSATFVLSKDAMPGNWSADLSSGDYSTHSYFRVEEYKQPKFMVSLEQPKVAPAFGQTYTLRGLAKAYSGANISDAKVKYTVLRTCNMFRRNGTSTDTSFTDSTVTAADGSFEIPFTPMPDTSLYALYRPVYRYTVRVDVTDLNGETHNASYSVHVGYVNKQISLADNKERTNELPAIRYSYSDLNGNPLEGDITLKIELLRLPDPVKLTPSVIRNNPQAEMTLGRDEFLRLYPNYAYSAQENRLDNWQTDWSHHMQHHADGSKSTYSVDLKDMKLPSGEYRIVATVGEVADTLYVTLVHPRSRTLPTADLLWMDAPQEAEVGTTCTVRYASAFDGTQVFYVLMGPDGQEIDSRWLTADRRIRSISIPVDSSLLGSFKVQFVTIRDGVPWLDYRTVTVPFTHKKLVVDIATFRDKLQPGEQEEWTIKVKGGEQGTESTLLMTMYDDALNSYGGQPRWQFYPWRYGNHPLTLWNQFRPLTTPYYQEINLLHYDIADYYKLNLAEGLFRRYDGVEVFAISMDESRAVKSTARGESGMVTMQGNVRKRTGVNVNSAKMAVQTADAVELEEEAALEAPAADLVETSEVKLRSNLSTLAFFVSDLRTDSSGTAIYRFRVPELLTRWNVHGLAFTDDLKIGTLDRTLVTQKPLMVQPNIPRFLRHGDSLVLMAKVVNLTDDERKVRVLFSLNNQNTPMILKEQMVTVPAQGSAQVTFPIADLPTDLYVATYEITAQTIDGNDTLATYSDGERGEIPVVSSRQAVTLSQPLYINGKGEKTFHFPLSTFHSSTTAEPHLLAAELVSNPVWLAIKSMPYLKQQENPSTLYLANSLYVNTLANKILEKLDIIEMLGKLADTANTRLKINEDVKQTLLEATPWLRDAEAEVEQRQAIANYFDSARLSEEFSKLNAQLASRQNSDGGWSWMPEGESSTWVTMQVLKRLSILKQSDNQAIKQSLSYVDREEQRHYEKYIKPYLKKYKWEPDNIEYLYTRSYYGKGSTEAYKFYYKNALKNYRKYNGLYTQAQLALIFQRHGDKKAARDLIRRIKEKSLTNDEMGMYWRDNRSGWCWYERPIETQSLLIQAFREVTPQDTASIALMQQWLLKQKQTTHWGNDRASVEAISALVMASTNVTSTASPTSLEALKSTTMTLCGIDLSAPSEGLEGYRSQRWEGPALDSIIALGDSTITIRKNTSGIAWGSVYFQYTDDMDKIPSSESGITISRRYELRGQTIQPPTSDLRPPTSLKVGDRIKVRIDISCDRTMEYLELIDGRPSCVEPLSTRAGWCWNDGLRYYVDVKNTATHCYINRLEKGKYFFEYEVYVTNPGTFLAGPVTMQCMYAPEFRATAPAQRLKVN